MALTSQQEKGIKLAKEWWHSERKYHQPFVISGLAGTGKSYLVQYIIEALNIDSDLVDYMAYSGAAAIALSRKNTDAVTIHHTIYSPYKDKKTNELKFKLKDSVAGSPVLFVVDEVGMLSEKIIKDLKSFHIPIIALGDNHQLGAFKGSNNNLLDHPDVVLDKPIRQSLDSGILRLAYKVLNGERIDKFRDSVEGEVLVCHRSELDDSMFVGADQILTNRNKTIQSVTNHVRNNIYHLDYLFPFENEKLICLKNNWDRSIRINNYDQYLVNGLTGYITEISGYNEKTDSFTFNFKPQYATDDKDQFLFLKADCIRFRENLMPNEKIEEYSFKMKENSDLTKRELADVRRHNDLFYSYKDVFYRRRAEAKLGPENMIDDFTFGYAMSVYKAQGSEFDNVLYIDDSWGSFQIKMKQRYTAITRAKKALIYVID